jgi:hypothetical protein
VLSAVNFNLGLCTSLGNRPSAFQVAFPTREVFARISYGLDSLNLPSQRFFGEVRHGKAGHPVDNIPGFLQQINGKVEGRTSFLYSRWHGSGSLGTGGLGNLGTLLVLPFTFSCIWDYRIEWILAKGAAAVCGSSLH